MTLLLRTPLVLDAATRMLRPPVKSPSIPPEMPVVIVTRHGVERTYHTTTVQALLNRMRHFRIRHGLPDSLIRRKAPRQCSSARDRTDATLATFQGVVLDGYQVYAVAGEPGRAAPAGSRGATPTKRAGNTHARGRASRGTPRGLTATESAGAAANSTQSVAPGADGSACAFTAARRGRRRAADWESPRRRRATAGDGAPNGTRRGRGATAVREEDSIDVTIGLVGDAERGCGRRRDGDRVRDGHHDHTRSTSRSPPVDSRRLRAGVARSTSTWPTRTVPGAP